MRERINKYLSEHGVCSRRAADRMIEAGRITVNGKLAAVGNPVCDKDEICIDGKPIDIKEKRQVVIALNKPRGIVCTATDRQGKNNIIDFLGYGERVYPVGRLDKDSEGLIFLTNDGDMTYNILKSSYGHEKEYVVTIDKPVTKEFIDAMSSGIYLKELDRTTRKCKVWKISKYTFGIILKQGLNKQIRRMCAECDCKVDMLKRIRIMDIELGDLKTGEYRELTDSEIKEIEAQLYAAELSHKSITDSKK